MVVVTSGSVDAIEARWKSLPWTMQPDVLRSHGNRLCARYRAATALDAITAAVLRLAAPGRALCWWSIRVARAMARQTDLARPAITTTTWPAWRPKTRNRNPISIHPLLANGSHAPSPSPTMADNYQVMEELGSRCTPSQPPPRAR